MQTAPNQYFRWVLFWWGDFNNNDLNQEVNRIIIDFESNNLTISRLEDLKESYKELLEYQINLLAFLYEMSCEDNPFRDYTKLKNELDNLRDKIRKYNN